MNEKTTKQKLQFNQQQESKVAEVERWQQQQKRKIT